MLRSSRRMTALIVVDMSVEQISAVSYKAKEVTDNCRKLLRGDTGNGGQDVGTNRIFDLCIDSRLWLHSPDESTLSWVYPETGRTLFVADSKGASLIPELDNCIPGNLQFCAKNNYSCFANSKLLEVLQQHAITDVCICGINTDYCVFATAMDAFQSRFRTRVVKDAVTSVRGKAAHEEGLRNLERHFGPQVLVTTEEVLAEAAAA